MTTYPMKLTCTKCGATDEGTLQIEDGPAREWVGLTPAEVHDIWCYNHTPQEVCDAVSAKLREKNA